MGDNWIVHQRMNCALALEPVSSPLPSQKHAYSSDSSLVTSATSWKDFFKNVDPRNDCPDES